jgi:hypothetical protein
MSAREGRSTLPALLGVFGVLAVCALAIWIWRGGETKPDIDAGRVAADQFLELIRTGKPADAWQGTTAEFKSAEGRESFLRYIKQHPFLTKPVDFVSVQMVAVHEQPRAEYLYRADKEGNTVRLLAGLDNNQWRVDRITIE